MNDLISVIIPIYNVEKYLDNCIESIVKQSYCNLEIILVDDGSPDKCRFLCDEWSKKDSRIKVIHKANGGLSDARNAGLNIATGDFIAFVDSDDFIEPELYEHLINVINKTSSDISFCNIKYIYENDYSSTSFENTNKITEYSTLEAMNALIDDKIRQVVWNKLYKKETISGIMFDIGKCHEDEFWSYKVIGNARRIAGIDYYGYNYMQRSGSIMGSNYSLKRLDIIEAKCIRQKYFEEFFPSIIQHGLKDLVFTYIYQGQKAIKFLSKADKKIALKILSEISFYIKELDFKNLTKKQQLWITLAKMSFIVTCKLRNFIKIGV